MFAFPQIVEAQLAGDDGLENATPSMAKPHLSVVFGSNFKLRIGFKRHA